MPLAVCELIRTRRDLGVIPRRGCRAHAAMCCILLNLVSLSAARGQASLGTHQGFKITFDATLGGVSSGAYQGNGFKDASLGSGQLDSDAWAATGWSDGDLTFGGTRTAGDYARLTDELGGISTGGFYAFDLVSGSATDWTFGIQPGGGDFAPGTLTLRIRNDTGGVISRFEISYDLWVRNDQPRANSFNASYASSDLSFVSLGLNFTSGETADGSTFINHPKSTAVSGVTILPGDYFYIRWESNDVSGSGSRDEFALDDISIAVPEPSTLALVAVGAGTLLRRRRRM